MDWTKAGREWIKANSNSYHNLDEAVLIEHAKQMTWCRREIDWAEAQAECLKGLQDEFSKLKAAEALAANLV